MRGTGATVGKLVGGMRQAMKSGVGSATVTLEGSLTAVRVSALAVVNAVGDVRDPRTGAVVEPYGVYDHKSPAAPGEERLYHVEFWPVGNRFRRGHRLRLDILGASGASKPGAPALDTVRVGGRGASRLLFPVLP